MNFAQFLKFLPKESKLNVFNSVKSLIPGSDLKEIKKVPKDLVNLSIKVIRILAEGNQNEMIGSEES